MVFVPGSENIVESLKLGTRMKNMASTFRHSLLGSFVGFVPGRKQTKKNCLWYLVGETNCTS